MKEKLPCEDLAAEKIKMLCTQRTDTVTMALLGGLGEADSPETSGFLPERASEYTSRPKDGNVAVLNSK